MDSQTGWGVLVGVYVLIGAAILFLTKAERPNRTDLEAFNGVRRHARQIRRLAWWFAGLLVFLYVSWQEGFVT